ncbi:MAG: hypothetical protein K6G23_10180 [Lachnospiraceae bacterium]|nr:hypothetical protein [Lachnospiraceae bacterium]
MTLLVSVFAAIVTTIIWYQSAKARELKISCLCWMFWGASLMWLADAIFEYAELGAAYFTPAIEDLVNDLFLGLSVIALAMVIWVVYFLIRDPKGVVKAAIQRK